MPVSKVAATVSIFVWQDDSKLRIQLSIFDLLPFNTRIQKPKQHSTRTFLEQCAICCFLSHGTPLNLVSGLRDTCMEYLGFVTISGVPACNAFFNPHKQVHFFIRQAWRATLTWRCCSYRMLQCWCEPSGRGQDLRWIQCRLELTRKTQRRLQFKVTVGLVKTTHWWEKDEK